MFTEPLAVYLKDFGVPSVFGSYTPLVLFDAPGQDILGKRAISIDYEITFITAQLPGLIAGSSITVNGVTYTVLEVLPLDDVNTTSSTGNTVWSKAILEHP